MTAKEIITANGKPGCRYATNKAQNAIAQWIDGRWRVIHVLTIDQKWINGGDGIMIDGKPAFPDESFIEVPHSN